MIIMLDSEFMSEDSVQSILSSEYGFVSIKTAQIDSYHNVNYLGRCRTSSQKEQQVIVKIRDQNANFAFDNYDFQHAFMLHLSENGFECSKPFRNQNGDTFVRHESDNSTCLLQVLSFVPGESLNSVKLSNEDFLRIGYDCGEKLGNLHKIGQLLEFDFVNKTPKYQWLPENALNSMEKLWSVRDEKMVREIKDYMASYETNFLPFLKCLRKGFNHGDFSDTNIILQQRDGRWEIGGVIDFDVCHYGYLVGDLGITIAYLLTKAVAIGCDVIPAAVSVIRGYQAINPLTAVEKRVLFEVVTSRLCISYVIGCFMASCNPENSEFIFLQSQHVPKVLKGLKGIGRDAVLQVFF